MVLGLYRGSFTEIYMESLKEMYFFFFFFFFNLGLICGILGHKLQILRDTAEITSLRFLRGRLGLGLQLATIFASYYSVEIQIWPNRKEAWRASGNQYRYWIGCQSNIGIAKHTSF